LILHHIDYLPFLNLHAGACRHYITAHCSRAETKRFSPKNGRLGAHMTHRKFEEVLQVRMYYASPFYFRITTAQRTEHVLTLQQKGAGTGQCSHDITLANAPSVS
jgi:hypothetical protein